MRVVKVPGSGLRCPFGTSGRRPGEEASLSVAEPLVHAVHLPINNISSFQRSIERGRRWVPDTFGAPLGLRRYDGALNVDVAGFQTNWVSHVGIHFMSFSFVPFIKAEKAEKAYLSNFLQTKTPF